MVQPLSVHVFAHEDANIKSTNEPETIAILEEEAQETEAVETQPVETEPLETEYVEKFSEVPLYFQNDYPKV